MKRFYAVQHGDNYDWDNGSYDYDEALAIAHDWAEWEPDEEIRIAFIDEDEGFCDDVKIVREAAPGHYVSAGCYEPKFDHYQFN